MSKGGLESYWTGSRGSFEPKPLVMCLPLFSDNISPVLPGGGGFSRKLLGDLNCDIV